jgi:hypothetical protein
MQKYLQNGITKWNYKIKKYNNMIYGINC